ncbi:MAG: hypothetical protein SFT90_02575 [Rickettsiales bacterium]|nr:hypothetical protein [Rickettsiales bacterium]
MKEKIYAIQKIVVLLENENRLNSMLRQTQHQNSLQNIEQLDFKLLEIIFKDALDPKKNNGDPKKFLEDKIKNIEEDKMTPEQKYIKDFLESTDKNYIKSNIKMRIQQFKSCDCQEKQILSLNNKLNLDGITLSSDWLTHKGLNNNPSSREIG